MNIFTIPPDAPFVDTLAQGLWDEAGGDPLRLAEGIVFLPTRRACRALCDAFLRIGGGRATLLPRLEPLGDVEDDFESGSGLSEDIPPALPALRRTMLLAAMIRKKEPDLPLDQAIDLARALAQLLDEVQTNERSFDDLPKLVEGELAQHWEITVAFLSILTKAWPDMLRAEGCLDPIARRTLLLDARAKAWEASPPDRPIIAAGSTASVPAVGRLMRVIAGLPKGRVVLPACDLELDEESWEVLGESHPQYGMKRWLDSCAVKRGDVKLWGKAKGERPARVRLWREALRPPERTEAWRDLKEEDLEGATQGLTRVELEHPEEEALAIAMMLRGALDVPGKTAALITPDRGLGERVSMALRRWGIEVDDSGGQTVPRTSLGAYLVSLLDAARPEASGLAFLALLKNPLAAWGGVRATCRAFARKAEIKVWRGLRRSDGLAGAARECAGEDPELAAWLAGLDEILDPLRADGEKTLEAWLALHIEVAEKIATSEEKDGAQTLWSGEAGEAAASFFAEARQASVGLPLLSGADYARLFAGLLRGVTIRPQGGINHRLSILGPLEARLWHPDLVILGGMNEGTWPPSPGIDPWLSRPMKKQFGLPLPERRVGLSAHDVAQLGAAPEVILTRARRAGGSPTVPSRFLMQIEAVLAAAFPDRDPLVSETPWPLWARAMDRPDRIEACAKPEPCPPLARRPTQLSVTEIGTWQRNPYAIYARRILKLSKLDALEEDISAADFGDVVHAALESFVEKTKQVWPEDPLALLLAEGEKALAPMKDRPQAAAFWGPRFERLARWFIAFEQKRRNAGYKPLKVECEGLFEAVPGFKIKGRADRIDETPEGAIEIIDYKTGDVPTQASIERGLEPQMPLLALLASWGGFQDLGMREVGGLLYCQVRGGEEEGREIPVKGDLGQLAEQAQEGLRVWVEAFRDPAMPYRAVPRPHFAPKYDDYGHLARLKEWGRG